MAPIVSGTYFINEIPASSSGLSNNFSSLCCSVWPAICQPATESAALCTRFLSPPPSHSSSSPMIMYANGISHLFHRALHQTLDMPSSLPSLLVRNTTDFCLDMMGEAPPSIPVSSHIHINVGGLCMGERVVLKGLRVGCSWQSSSNG